MSKLAHAGDSNTVSPGSVWLAATCTASSMEEARTHGTDLDQACHILFWASPINTASLTFSLITCFKDEKSKPLSRPPAMSTECPGRERSAFSTASLLVAFESLMKETPATSVTNSQRCGCGLYVQIASRIRATGNPIARPVARVASTFSALCAPRRFVSLSFMSMPWHSGKRHQIVSASDESNQTFATRLYALKVMARARIGKHIRRNCFNASTLIT